MTTINIELTNCFIRNEAHGFVTVEKKLDKDGKQVDGRKRFYSRIDYLADALMRDGLERCSALSLKELIAAQKVMSADIAAILSKLL